MATLAAPEAPQYSRSSRSFAVQFSRFQCFAVGSLAGGALEDNALPFKLGVFEIQDEADLMAGDAQVVEHLNLARDR